MKVELGLVGKNGGPNEIRVGSKHVNEGKLSEGCWDPNFGSDSSRFTIFWGSQMVETSKQTMVKSFP